MKVQIKKYKLVLHAAEYLYNEKFIYVRLYIK